MKAFQFFLAVFLVMLGPDAFSQDTLFTNNGNRIGAKVIEINQDEVKYKKSENPDGPLYVINKSDVVLIEFRNGTKEVFTANSDGAINNTNNNTGDNNDNANSDPVYVNQRPSVNVVIGALPYLSVVPWALGWGWGNGWVSAGWGRHWGWGRGHYHGWKYSGNGGHGNFGHYGRRGGGHR